MLAGILAVAVVVVGPGNITKPDWITLPTGDDLARYYPDKAAQNEISGRATIFCGVDARGRLTACRIAEEDPAGLGFGDAALKLADLFRMKPLPPRPDGAPLTIRVPIHFVMGSARQATYGGANTIGRPVWSAAPTFEQALAAFPGGLAAGKASLTFDCRVAAAGSLEDCRPVVAADPVAARAARTLLPAFRIFVDPAADRHGREVRVNVPIRLIDPTSDEGRRRTVDKPRWVAAPEEEIVSAAYPRQAAASGIAQGRAVLTCHVVDGGRLAGCTTTSENPPGVGFDQAAMTIADGLRVNLWSDEGAPVVGGSVRVPMRFEQPEAPAASAPKP